MEESRPRPVPKPRKTLTELKKTEYENVAINLINKNLIINSENLQGDDVVDKVPNNKLFIPQVTILPSEDEVPSSSSKSILTETNNLHPDKNQNLVSEKPQNNFSIEASDDDELYEKLPNSSPSSSNVSPRRPPELPPKTYMNVKRESMTSLSNNSFSDGGHKSESSITLDSSHGSTGSGENSSRFKNPSPGDLLKSIGSTSKLLTQSVGERITARAKGARSKLDKNLKTSHEFISSLGHETSDRLKTVGKQISTFSLKKKSKKECQFNEDRPQTLPPNDSVFESISFNSPLKESTGVCDLTRDEGSYEVPRSTKISSDDSLPPHPPSYEDVMKENFQRNIPQTKSLMTVKKDNNFNLTRTNSDPDLNDVGVVGKFTFKQDDDASLPMPTYPPPKLPEIELSTSPVYSMVKKNEPPVKPKRKTKSIEPELRQLETVPESTRATIDSLELRNSLDSRATRDISMEIAEEIHWKEKLTHKPNRSESWEYYENDNESNSSTEPVYANQEQFYGKLSEMKTKEDLLAPSDGACALVLNDLNGNSQPGTSKDLLYEFDPLVKKNLTLCKSGKTNELLLLEYLIEEDIYGSNSNVAEGSNSSMDGDSAEGDNMVIVHQNSSLPEAEEVKPQNTVELPKAQCKQTQWYDRNSMENTDTEAPPTYFEAISETTESKLPDKDNKSRTSFTAKFTNVINRMSVKRKSSMSKKPSDLKVAIEMVPRPSLSQQLVRHDGPLIRFPSGVVEDILKELQNRRALLRDKRFQTYLEQEMKTPKEIIPLENITSIQCVINGRVTDNATHYFCFELTSYSPKSSSANQQLSSSNVILSSSGSGNCKMQRSCHLYGVARESERDIWMQKLAESLTDVFQSNYTCQYYRMGWCYMKKSITSEWSGTWVILRKRKRRLVFHSENVMNVEKLDLRKARCIVMKETDDSIKHLHVESGPILMIDCPPHTIYMIMAASRETKLWRQAIREVAHNNGPQISDQQLTKFNVPVIVDKCINFVYIHGSMSEGIYRKSGSEQNIQKLLQEFRTNAFNVEITRNDYSENDVANVLKRFMRDLPHRLLGKHSESFISITTLEPQSEKINAYRELLSRLYTIEYETLKKLVGHLAFIHSMRSKNKMEIKNLAVIWGPTLLQKVEDVGYSQQDAEVVSDLVLLYKHIFPLSDDEIKKEQEMLMCLQRYYASAETLADSVKQSGDLKIWITVDPKPEEESEEKDQVNVTITPTKTAYEVCKELSGRMKLSIHQLSLYEVVLNGSLRRPLHHDEKVFDAILKWSHWSEEDKKNNYLVVTPIDILKEVERVIRNSPSVLPPARELKFADNRTKTLKSFFLELKSGKIAVMKKEKNGSNTIVKEIFLHNTTVYLGCEKKRDCPWSWSLTFIENLNKDIVRTRETPFVGHVVAGSEWADRIMWFASIWYNFYGENALPPAEIILK